VSPSTTASTKDCFDEAQKPAVLTEAEARQQLLEAAARADVYEAIRQGQADIANGRTRPAREVLEEIRRRYRIFRDC
jgi:predicted transcriptional regulator